MSVTMATPRSQIWVGVSLCGRRLSGVGQAAEASPELQQIENQNFVSDSSVQEECVRRVTSVI